MAVNDTSSKLLGSVESGNIQESNQERKVTCVRVTTAFIAAVTGIASLSIRFGSCKEKSNEECESEHEILKPAETMCAFSLVAGAANEIFRCCFPRS